MKKNVIFIMCDTLRFDYLGCYGNDWIKTPNIDRLAREGTVFENAYTDGLPTIPNRRGLLTGRLTLPFKGWGPLEMDDTTVADILWGRGIHTALIYDSCPMQAPKYGYNRGFHDVIYRHGHEMEMEYYSEQELVHLNPDDYIEEHTVSFDEGDLRSFLAKITKKEVVEFLKLRQHWRSEEDNFAPALVKEGIRWLEHVDKTHPFMLWFDCFDPHEPWDPPSIWDPDLKCPYDPDYKGKDMFMPLIGPVEGVFTEEELHHIRMLYAEKITMIDKWLGKLFDKVKELGLWDDTMIIFTSDHGSPMGNGEHGHGLMRKSRPWPYEELSHVPLIVRVPGVGEGTRISAFSQPCDVAPTILDYLGQMGEARNLGLYFEQKSLPGVEEMHGKSLIPVISGEKDKIRDFAVSGYYGVSWSIIRDDYSYIHWLRDNKAPMEIMYDYHDGGSLGAGESSKRYREEVESMTDLWTCTPGAEVIVPQIDELYERASDPYQLNNIADKHPEKAKELLQQLRGFMAELRTT